MEGFGGFLRQDLDAVTAGPTLPWSSDVVEGYVNRVKTSEREMSAGPGSNSSGPASSLTDEDP